MYRSQSRAAVRRSVVILMYSLGAALAVAPARSQSYPERPIRLIVPFPAGGNADIYARPIARQLAAQFNARVVVDNRPGAGGAIGGELAARALPDGHTLVMGTTSTFGIGPNLHALPYHPLRDFTPVVLVSLSQNMLIARRTLPARSVRELIELARAQPGALRYASAGVGSSSHVAGELFNSLTRAGLVHVPYQGTSLALLELLSGEVDVIFDSLSTALPAVRAGRVQALAVTGARRLAAMPELPTLAEAGVPGYHVTAWTGMLAPAGTPRPVVEMLNAAANRALRHAEIRRVWADQGAEPGGGSPERFGAHIRAELAKWGAVIREAGIRVQ